MKETILVINAGSSSIKFSAYKVADQQDPTLSLTGQIEGIGTRPRLIVKDGKSSPLIDKSYDASTIDGYESAIETIAGWFGTLGSQGQLFAVGHRIVHGGLEAAPVLIDDKLLDKLEEAIPLMPLHLPSNLAAIRALRKSQPSLPQIACFDTTFHRGRPAIADRFALPDALYREGVRRYGFHGLSYEYITEQLQIVAPEIATGKVIIAHLGSGASMCALRGGKSVDTTMAFSALDGLPMNTRCGALDPGVVIYLLREKRMSPDLVERLLYRESGLRGLSGLSGDVRDLLASRSPEAKFALDYFVYHTCRELGGLVAVLKGLDAIVFTAGIGENSVEIRERICLQCAWLGLRLDFEANRAGGPRISAPGSAVSAWVIPTNEELVIARHTVALMRPLVSLS
jgi:acetate kinase